MVSIFCAVQNMWEKVIGQSKKHSLFLLSGIQTEVSRSLSITGYYNGSEKGKN